MEHFLNFTFFQKISSFSSANISDYFFYSSTTNFEFLPYYPCFSTFSPLFLKNYYFPPTLTNFPLFSKNSPAFCILYVYFVSPLLWPWCIYASPNARTGRIWFQAYNSKHSQTFILCYRFIAVQPHPIIVNSKLLKRHSKAKHVQGTSLFTSAE